MQQVCAGYVYGDYCSGQHAAYAVGLSGVPVFNVNNNCSMGGTALLGDSDTVTIANLYQSNGVIHVVDKVLLSELFSAQVLRRKKPRMVCATRGFRLS